VTLTCVLHGLVELHARRAGGCAVKLAVPCLKLVVEIRGESHATKSWVDVEGGYGRAPWDGDQGSIQEFFHGVSAVKAGSYKDAYKICLRKQVEEARAETLVAVNEASRRRSALSLAVNSIRKERGGLQEAISSIKAQRKLRQRQEILSKVSVVSHRHTGAHRGRAPLSIMRSTPVGAPPLGFPTNCCMLLVPPAQTTARPHAPDAA